MNAKERREVDLIGRAQEVESISRGLERSRKDRVPTIIEIEGEAGIGKSALIQAATAHARASGWLAAVATCYAIQSQIPLSTTRRLLRELLEAMGDEREHYATGLQRVLESSAPNAGAQGLTRLLDGVTLDRPVLLAIDDAQWADADSLEFIGDLLSNSSARAIAVLEATRPRANGVHLTPNTVIPLHPLDDRHARAVARRLLPSTAPNVIDAIVNHARGYPIDIVALANAIADRNHPSIDDVASSRRSAIARDVRSAAPPLREFLQVCSLMGGPIAYRLLERLWPDRESLDALVTLCTGRYLRTTDLGLEFEHDLIAEAVRQTIAIPSPYRRKIIAALQSLESPSLEELQALASQLAECADRIGAFSVLADVARKAAAAGQTRLTVSASTQALNFADPPLDYARTFLPDYADALFALDRDSEAVSVIERALRLFDRAGANLPGSAVARLILALCFSDQLSTAQSTYARFLPTMRNTADRAHLLSAAIWFAVCHDNLEQAESLEKEILLLPGDLPFTVKIRMRNFKAFVLSLHGNHDAAMALLDEAAAIAREAALLGPIGITTDQINVPKLFLSTWEYGTRVLEPLVEERHRASYDEERTPADEYFLAFAEFLAGHWNRAEARIAGVVDRNPRPTATRRFLTLAAAIAALRQCDSPYRKTIEGDVSAFLLGRREGWFVPVAAWWAAVTAQSERQMAAAILADLFQRVAEPSDPHVYLPKLAMVLLAHRLSDEASLSALASGAGWTPSTPWHRVHDRIARGIAASLLGARAKNDLTTSIPLARELGLTVYADLAAATLNKRDADALSRLSALGIVWLNAPGAIPKGTFVGPTPRELEVAYLVAQGKTNQEIADTLVLSQRTVEVHIGNLFNKVGVTSRTQLATWYLRSHPE